MMRRLGRLATVLAGASLLALAAAPAVPASAIDRAGSTVADSARLNAAGTALQLSGVVRCGACRSFTLGATVSQGSSGAIGQGGVRCVCRGASERWLVTARVRESTTFRAGPARICVWVTARGASGRAIDARQWCESVRLTSAEA